MNRTWSTNKDGFDFFYTTDGIMPQLNVRYEGVGWTAYCGDVSRGGFPSALLAQDAAEKHWRVIVMDQKE
jgi:hypothetical protein